MYAIYFSEKYTNGKLRLFGVVKFEPLAIEMAEIFSFEYRWDRYQIRYCRSPYLEYSIPPFAVSSFRKSGDLTYYGFFKTAGAAKLFADHMRISYPGISFNVHDITETHELRASHMDTQSALF